MKTTTLCLLAVLFTSGCASRRPNIWERAPAPLMQVPQRNHTPTKPIYSVDGCDFMEFVEGQGLVLLSAEKVVGYLESGEEVIIYDRKVEGDISSSEQAARLRNFLKERSN